MTNPNFPSDIPCQCYSPEWDICVCPNEERALRNYSKRNPALPPMTQDQRDWCLDEISKSEGYVWREYESVSDDILAATVLNAWVDYARDKGLL